LAPQKARIDMKSSIACIGLVVLVGMGVFSPAPASAAKAVAPLPLLHDDPALGLDSRLIEDVENEKYKVCDRFPGKGRGERPKKCRGLSP
jgi:hypothetical protein